MARAGQALPLPSGLSCLYRRPCLCPATHAAKNHDPRIYTALHITSSGMQSGRASLHYRPATAVFWTLALSVLLRLRRVLCKRVMTCVQVTPPQSHRDRVLLSGVLPRADFCRSLYRRSVPCAVLHFPEVRCQSELSIHVVKRTLCVWESKLKSKLHHTGT